MWKTVYAEQHPTRVGLKGAVKKADILWVGLGHQVDREIITCAPNLRCIVSPTTGTDHIDLLACIEQGIDVLSLQGETQFLSTVWATAEHTIALLLSLMRKIPDAANHTIKGYWDRTLFLGHELRGKTVVIVGYGRVGKQVTRLLTPWGCVIIPVDKSGNTNMRLMDSLPMADVVICCTDNQQFGSREFNAMKIGTYFVNTARGFKIDEGAIIKALRDFRLEGAALDVVQSEVQKRKDNIYWTPLLDYAKSHPNRLIVTPHIGGYTSESIIKTEDFMKQRLEEWKSCQSRQ
jgi:lactate dehydrogenase-like 2-hydroxyacid dehydrogenase